MYVCYYYISLAKFRQAAQGHSYSHSEFWSGKSELFGEKGLRYTLHATDAVRSTVNGMVLIGLGKGLLMGIAYAIAGLSHPAMLGALTGVFAKKWYKKIGCNPVAALVYSSGNSVAVNFIFD